jgi:hypothetical protein
MSRHRRTADDFVRDMKARQQHSTPGDIERKTSEGTASEHVDDPAVGNSLPLQLSKTRARGMATAGRCRA